MKKTAKTLFRTFACVACFASAPFAASAQDTGSTQPLLIDVFQDGTLYITYDEYLERQRRVLAARNAGQTAAPLAIPTRRPAVTAQVARNSSVMQLQDQWQIGAFR
ncbi:MAG: hypothetical protein ABJO29_00325 [Yoonia sp.]|uniref:hypothetical protein n=1 Tax=Yoonia sp. TaxID=2212373 RepID=UPI003299101D